MSHEPMKLNDYFYHEAEEHKNTRIGISALMIIHKNHFPIFVPWLVV